ncbi:hypothetical protein MRB53_036198 [Persea americana]|uniref:Uncharacterized protein n=1 Tax=Persea americana TaxID=3435 RepID=A0ACC2K6W2_PERAE|nr:hypothetical protein MRB53_036198 [Persea americana]
MAGVERPYEFVESSKKSLSSSSSSSSSSEVTSLAKEINARLEKIEPKTQSFDGLIDHFVTTEMKSTSHSVHNKKRNSQKANNQKTKNSARESALYGGESDVTEKPVEPVKVFSEKELIREIDNIACTLVPEKDWSVRIAAMQRAEGLVLGGATDFPSFTTLLKQLVNPLSTQLSDRRSSIVKQACRLLCLLSKELLGDFEACAEMFIPVLIKLVVITVLVIAESAANCIKTMLRNCKVARVLPRIADCAKNDRSSMLRARCCEYALLILEYWADAPEIQRSADLYEDLIKCCVADAMSEVRSIARTCYRMFAKTWPERSRRLFICFDPAVQRLMNEEDGGANKRYASPSFRERGRQLPRTRAQTHATNLSGYGTSAIVAMDRSATIAQRTALSSGSLFLAQPKLSEKGTERSLESMLHASKQKVTAIESMLRAVNISEKLNSAATHSSSLDLGADPPTHDPPFSPANPATDHLKSQNPSLADSGTVNIARDSVHNEKRSSERLHEGSFIEENPEIRLMRRFPNTQVDKHYLDAPCQDTTSKYSNNSYVPNFQRPLLRKQAIGRSSGRRRNSFDDSQFSVGDMSSCMDGPVSLSEALTEGLTPSSDWCARVCAFNYIRTLLHQGSKGIQGVAQSFGKVMKLFFQHLDDPHYKVAQAALSALAEIIPAFRKPFESYLERILPHVFSRLVDPKEMVRQSSSTTLEIISKTYRVDSLLPALLRSLDEQRSPKAKLAVIEYANNSFDKHVMNSEGSSNSGLLKLWLAKLAPLATDKNAKLKETAITGIISVYSHFDSTAVVSFILSLSIEEQNSLRRALKQYTPRIEVELVNFLQNKKEHQHSKSFYDQSVVGSSSEEGYVVTSKKSHPLARCSASSIDSDGGKKCSRQERTQISGSTGQTTSDEIQDCLYQNFETGSNIEVLQSSKGNDMKCNVNTEVDNGGLLTIHPENGDCGKDTKTSIPDPSVHRLVNSDHQGVISLRLGSESLSNIELIHEKFAANKANPTPDSGPSIPQLLHQICNGNDENSNIKRVALQQLVEACMANNHSFWTKYFNQILTTVLEVFDDPDSSIRELALSLMLQMLKNQKEAIEDSVDIVIEKLLHATKDTVAKVSSEADHCLIFVLSQYDPYKCLCAIEPLLVGENEKTLATCVNCLTKLVGRLSQEELMAQLPTFLPALFDAFGNQSADVRKTVVFCLVDIYIILGEAFLPYLKGLNSTQLRLVTIYANRISQARSGAVNCD